MIFPRETWKWVLVAASLVVVIYVAWPRLLAEYYYQQASRVGKNRVSAIENLWILGEAGRPAMIRLLKDRDRLNRAFAAERLRSGGDDVLFALMEAAKNDPDEEVRWEAISSLGYLGDVRALPLLREIDRTEQSWRAQSAMIGVGEPGITAVLEDYRINKNPDKRARRLGMLCGIRSRGDPRVQRAIMDAMNDEHWELRATFAGCVKGMLGEDSAQYLEVLLDDRKAEVRVVAAAQLGELGRNSGLDAMKRIVLDESVSEILRGRAARVMGVPRDKAVAEFLRNLIRTQQSSYVVSGAHDALNMLFPYKGDPEVETYYDTYLEKIYGASVVVREK